MGTHSRPSRLERRQFDAGRDEPLARGPVPLRSKGGNLLALVDRNAQVGGLREVRHAATITELQQLRPIAEGHIVCCFWRSARTFSSRSSPTRKIILHELHTGPEPVYVPHA